jgi:RNA polymerase sigma-70 factor, ECF subfamily
MSISESGSGEGNSPLSSQEEGPSCSSESTKTEPETWLDEHGNFLYRFALARVQNQHVAEDLVQETLLSAILTHASFEGKSAIQTWLTAILKRKIADYFRKTGRKLKRAEEDERLLSKVLDATMSNPEFRTVLERSEFVVAFQACLARLPTHLSEAFMMRIRSDQGQSELARGLQISKANLAVRLFRARVLLRRCLEETWLGETTESGENIA